MLFNFYFHHTEWQPWLKKVYSIYSSFSIWCQRVGQLLRVGWGAQSQRECCGQWGRDCQAHDGDEAAAGEGGQPWLWLPLRVSENLFFLPTSTFFTTQVSCYTNLIIQPPGWAAWAGVWHGHLLRSAGFLWWLSAPHIQNSVPLVSQPESMIYLICFLFLSCLT